MKDITLETIQKNLTNPQQLLSNNQPEKGGGGFESILSSSLKEVNDLQLQANQAVQELAAGKKESIHETMIALEKASVSFDLMMQIRNKIVDAYQEIIKTSM